MQIRPWVAMHERGVRVAARCARFERAHAQISAPLCCIHVYIYIYIRVYGRAARVCCAMCWRPFAHTCAHTRMREVQARLILPDRATCIYCALFRACAFFRDVDRIDDSGKSMLPFALFSRGGFTRFLFWRSRRAGKSQVTKRWCKRRSRK